MNNLDNLLAIEMQQQEFNFLMTEDSLFSNIIGTSLGLNILGNSIQFNNESLENEENETSENEENQTSENNETLNYLNENLQNVDNSFMRFYQSMMAFAEEGQNAFDDNPESIPAQIYDSIFNFTPEWRNPEWRNLSRGANSYIRMNNSLLSQSPPIPQTYNEPVLSEQSDNSIGNMIFNIINSGLSYAQRNEFQNMLQTEMNSIPIILDSNVLNSFELKKYSEVKESDNRLCTICLVDHDNEDIVRILKCNHFFHKDCIDEWLNKHSYKCPVCRCELGSSHPNVGIE